jgi:hypothetical protein
MRAIWVPLANYFIAQWKKARAEKNSRLLVVSRVNEEDHFCWQNNFLNVWLQRKADWLQTADTMKGDAEEAPTCYSSVALMLCGTSKSRKRSHT